MGHGPRALVAPTRQPAAVAGQLRLAIRTWTTRGARRWPGQAPPCGTSPTATTPPGALRPSCDPQVGRRSRVTGRRSRGQRQFRRSTGGDTGAGRDALGAWRRPRTSDGGSRRPDACPQRFATRAGSAEAVWSSVGPGGAPSETRHVKPRQAMARVTSSALKSRRPCLVSMPPPELRDRVPTAADDHGAARDGHRLDALHGFQHAVLGTEGSECAAKCSRKTVLGRAYQSGGRPQSTATSRSRGHGSGDRGT